MHRLLVGVIALLMIGIFAACGGGGDGDQTIDTGDGEVNISDDRPDDFPDDIPEYDGANFLGSISGESDGQEGTIVTYDTDDGADDVSSFYESELEAEGWTIESKTSVGGSTIMYATKDDRAVTVTLGDSGDGKTAITIFYGTAADVGSGDGSDSGDGDSGDGDDSGDDSSDDGSDSGDGGDSGDADLPDEVSVDDAFPSEIGLPGDAYVIGSSSISSGGAQTVFLDLLSEESVDDLESHFTSEFEGAGYSEAVRTSADGDVYMSFAKNPDDPSTDVVVLTISSANTSYEGYTEVTITVTQAEE